MRQETVFTSRPPTNGPRIVVAAEAPAQTPNARPRSSPSKLAVMIESDPGTTNAPAAPCSTRATIRNSIDGARPHSSDVAAKPSRPKREHLAPPVEVGEPAREDQQGAERHEVAVGDVGLRLEGAEQVGRQILADARQREVHDRRVEEHDRRAEDDGDHRPSLLRRRHARSVSQSCPSPAPTPYHRGR